MSVVGVGLDVVDTGGFARQLADAASGFEAATYTPAERRAQPDGGERRVQGLAARFAAKEAFLKAWSSARRGRSPRLSRVDLRDIEVVIDGFGRPGLRLHGPVARALEELAQVEDAGGAASGGIVAHLSVSHDGPVAAAVVVLESDLDGRRREQPR